MFSTAMCAIRKTNVHKVAANVWSSIVMRQESNLSALRKKTGKALEANENDLNRAEKWLNEEAAKHGWDRASKLQNRRAAQGLIGVFVDREHVNGFLVEVNCESDFVGRNEHFKNLVVTMMESISTAPHINTNCGENTRDRSIHKYEVDVKDLDIFKDKISAAVVKLGENIKLSRASIIKNNDKLVRLIGYTHASAGQSSDINGVQLGKYGTIIAVKQLPEKADDRADLNMHTESTNDTSKISQEAVTGGEEEAPIDARPQKEIVKVSIEEASKVICQHIIGVKPKCVSLTEEQLMAEKERKAAVKDTELESDALIYQKLLINENVTVKDYLKFQNVDVIDFIRFECGESIN